MTSKRPLYSNFQLDPENVAKASELFKNKSFLQRFDIW